MENRDEEKLILAKLNDKIRLSKTRNKIVNTEFLNMYQESVVRKEIERIKLTNYIFTGGYAEAESKILIIYPDKLTEQIINQNIKNIIKAIKIELPNEQKGKYQHKDYLGTIMQFGITRERVGDIIVFDDKAYIIILQENAQYIKDSLITTRKFKKSNIEIIEGELVSVNGKIETRQSKTVETGDILIIRRHGKFIVDNFLNINKKGKQIVIIKKYK